MNGGSSVSVDKLVGNNYSYRKLCMEAYLQGQNLWDLISGDDVVILEDTPQNVELRRKWKIKYGKALFALRTSISQEYIQHVRDGKSPKQVWKTLERLFTQKNTMRLQFLKNELAGMTQDNLSILEYFLKIKTLCSEISELDTEEPVSDARLHRYLILGLRKEFMPFISSIQGWANQPFIIELENLLSNQEALMKQIASNNKQSPSQVEDALYTKDKAKSNSFSKHSSADSKQSKTKGQSRGNSKSYYRCGKLGHLKRDCHVKVVCNRCEKSVHIKQNCRVNLIGANVAHKTSKFEQLKWEQCLSIEAVDQPDILNSVVQQTNVETYANASIDYSKDWIVDFGCSHHAIGNAYLLSEVCPHYGKRAIVTADNSLHPIVKEGDFNVKKDISNVSGVSLKDVYHVPSLKKNLASVSQIVDSGRYVLFGPDDVKIISNIKHLEADVLFTGKRKDSLYVLSASDAYVEKTGQNASMTLWHARLGHVGYQFLQKISTKKLLDGVPLFKEIHQDVVCPGCQYGKSHHLPFLNSKNKATAALQLVFFLEHKSETFSKFIQFKEQVEKEFGLPIKCLRIDNGGEYMSDQFLNYCREHDIRCRMTCPETPQQNGVAERKLAHLTSMCLSWLHAKSLPRELWAAAIQEACHVINRLPPWPGTESSHFEALYHHKPNVSYFRVFSSVCYVHVSKTNWTKPDPRARRCIFVGYNTHKKGWRCMDPKTKKVLVSYDVVFDKVSSYQINANTNRGMADLSPFFSNDASSEKGSNTSSSGETIQQDEVIGTAIQRRDRVKVVGFNQLCSEERLKKMPLLERAKLLSQRLDHHTLMWLKVKFFYKSEKLAVEAEELGNAWLYRSLIAKIEPLYFVELMEERLISEGKLWGEVLPIDEATTKGSSFVVGKVKVSPKQVELIDQVIFLEAKDCHSLLKLRTIT
ncbi:hypothetical protein F0562_001542 [Nyssa sinensis]|uniref:Integrase catalytic domain-containing protein n=1 Tax=Nyssa sinensis TaxID=561372 RepID=A0A5J5C3K7_9ASTE|nr:hypothetical protein F0562_001542 [Nyssa sinensis]